MSRHPLVTERALALPPVERDEGFEQLKLDRLRQLYQLTAPRLPKYRRTDSRYCAYKMEMVRLLEAYIGLAASVGVGFVGFQSTIARLRSVPNYYQKGQRFYSDLKHSLELSLVRFEQLKAGDYASQAKLRTQLAFIERQIEVCPGGLFTSTNQMAMDLDPAGSELASLEECRQHIVKDIAEEFNRRYAIPHGNSIHTTIKVKKTAYTYGFSLKDGAANAAYQDRNGGLIPYSHEDELDHGLQMHEAYTPELIRQNLVVFYTERMLDFRKSAADMAVLPDEGADGGAIEQKEQPVEAAGGGLQIVIEAHAPVAHVMHIPAPAALEPPPRHRKKLTNPDNVAELQRVLQPLFDTGVISSIHDVIEWSEDFTDGWVGSDFMQKLPAVIAEHVIRQGYTLSPELVYLNELNSKMVSLISEDDRIMSAENRVIVMECCKELMAFNYMPYFIPDGELHGDGIAPACVSHVARGEAALHIMQQLLLAYQPNRQLQLDEDLEGISVTDDVFLSQLNVLVAEYAHTAKITADPAQCTESYKQVQLQAERVVKLDQHQAELRQVAKLEQAKQSVATNLQSVMRRWQVKQQFQHSNAMATKIQQATRGYLARLHTGDWQADRVRRVVNAIVEPYKTTENKKQALAYQLAFHDDSAAPAESNRMLVAIKDKPAGTLLSKYNSDFNMDPYYWRSYCVTEDNELHLSCHATWGLTPTTGYVTITDEAGVSMSKIVRSATRDDFNDLKLNRLMNLHLMRDEYAEMIAGQWRPEWLTAENFKQLSALGFNNVEPDRFGQCLQVIAAILPKLPGQCLTDDVMSCVNRWLSQRYKSDVYPVSIFLSDIECLAAGENNFVQKLFELPYDFVTNFNMKKLGGISAFTPQLISLLKRVKFNAWEVNDVHFSSQLTDRAVAIIHHLLGMPEKRREQHIARINSYVGFGCHATTIAITLFPQYCSELMAPVLPAVPAQAVPTPAAAAGAVGMFAPLPLARRIEPREQGMFDRAMIRYIDAVHKEVAVFMADGIRTVELDFYDKQLDTWGKPYQAEHLHKLYDLVSYMQYIAQSDRSRYRANPEAKRANCERLFVRIETACTSYGVMTRVLAREDFIHMRDRALASFRELDLGGGLDDVPVYQVRL
ncbi:MAG: hypothetical protein P1U63_03675 [Coxiellaceae bacterium]|nr:hypothetical protein [Coxiellaceae bacterium]